MLLSPCRLDKTSFAENAGDTVGRQQLFQSFSLGELMTNNYNSITGIEPLPESAGKRHQRMGGFLGYGHTQTAVVLTGNPDQLRHGRFFQDKAGQLQAAAAIQQRLQLLFIQIQFRLGRVRQALQPRLAFCFGQFQAEARYRLMDGIRVNQRQGRAGGIVKDRLKTGMQQRLEVFDAPEIDRIFQVLQNIPSPVRGDLKFVATSLQARRNVG